MDTRQTEKIPILQTDIFCLMASNDDSYYIDLLKEIISEAVGKSMGSRSLENEVEESDPFAHGLGCGVCVGHVYF